MRRPRPRHDEPHRLHLLFVIFSLAVATASSRPDEAGMVLCIIQAFRRRGTPLSSLGATADLPGRVAEEERGDHKSLPRLYVGSGRALSTGTMVLLSPEQSHRLINVMRIFKRKRRNKYYVDDDSAIGRIRIFNGVDGEWLARVVPAPSTVSIAGMSKALNMHGADYGTSLVAECVVQLRPQDRVFDEMRPWLLFVPLKKQPRIKIMIEKCTEIGVGRMIPIASDRMEDNALMSLFRGPVFNDVGDNVLQSCKLQLQSIEASEQCERLNVPMIMIDSISTRAGKTRNELCTVKDYLQKWCHEWEESADVGDMDKSSFRFISSESSKKRNEWRTLLICRERRTDGVVPVLQALQENNRVAFLVGPEGGWSAEEELIFDEICSKYKGMGGSPVQCVSLGSSILRAETACMMVVGAWALLNDSPQLCQ